MTSRIPSPSSVPSPTGASCRSARASCASRSSVPTISCATREISPSPWSRRKPPGKAPARAPTNLLFFDRAGPTKDVWYYEQPLPEGRKNYTKTQPIQFEEFRDCMNWWGKREENDRVWKVPAAELLANGCNLDRKNPSAKEDVTHLLPEELVASILDKERHIAEIVGKIQTLLAKSGA